MTGCSPGKILHHLQRLLSTLPFAWAVRVVSPLFFPPSVSRCISFSCPSWLQSHHSRQSRHSFSSVRCLGLQPPAAIFLSLSSFRLNLHATNSSSLVLQGFSLPEPPLLHNHIDIEDHILVSSLSISCQDCLVFSMQLSLAFCLHLPLCSCSPHRCHLLLHSTTFTKEDLFIRRLRSSLACFFSHSGIDQACFEFVPSS